MIIQNSNYKRKCLVVFQIAVLGLVKFLVSYNSRSFQDLSLKNGNDFVRFKTVKIYLSFFKTKVKQGNHVMNIKCA